MRIVADENIAGVREICAGLGEIALVDGRRLQRSQLATADILLVRSVTRVDASLLDGTPVRFVGTATAGTDHVDLEYLRARRIGFADAPGCNSIAVAEYVIACCLAYADEHGLRPADLTVGVIGHGHVGTALVARLQVLGIAARVNDPPLAAARGTAGYVALAEVLTADVVTLHVPLTDRGPYATRGLIGRQALSAMQPASLLINAARGGVVDEHAWFEGALRPALALDCWQDEPSPHPEIVRAAWVATPHIAGHTVDARLRATRQIVRELARAFPGATLGCDPGLDVPPTIDVGATQTDAQIAECVFACCDPRAWSSHLQSLAAGGTRVRGEDFDLLRRQFGVRREFAAHTVAGARLTSSARVALLGLGFRCTT